MSTQFTAWADPDLVRNTSNFFDNHIRSITRELLQNARRSGATEVRMTLTGNIWSYRDNGPGCSPQSLMGLGSSNWGESVKSRETPAGCGFASLSRRNPSVTSPHHGWEMDLTEEHFNGIIPIEVNDYTPDPSGSGLFITFEATMEREATVIMDLAKYMEIDFYLDGKQMISREPFNRMPLDCRAYDTMDFDEDIRITVGIVPETSPRLRFNYNGWVVYGRDYNNCLNFHTTEGTFSYVAKFEIKRENALPLELPQRNQLIESKRLKEVKRFAHNMALQLAAGNLAEISIETPATWLAERRHGYNGPVCYPKFAGLRLTREPDFDLAEYQTDPDDVRNDGPWYAGAYVTWEEMEASNVVFGDNNETLCLLAQTMTYVGEGDEQEYITTPEEFFPGLQVIKPVYGFPYYRRLAGEEGHEWFEAKRDLYIAKSAWIERLRLRVCTKDDGVTHTFEEPLHNLAKLAMDETPYEDLSMVLLDSEGLAMASAPVVALFDFKGSTDTDITFVVTRTWLQAMHNGFLSDVVAVACKLRKWENSEDGEDSMHRQAFTALEKEFAKLTDLRAFVEARMKSLLVSRAEELASDFEEPIRGIILKVPLHNSVGLEPSLEIIPDRKAVYTFEGSEGTVRCDADGNRMPFEELMKTPRVYPEYHKFDVASLKQMGSTRTEMDILDVGGWHDSTMRIYVTPVLAHTLWNAGLLPSPVGDTTNEEELAAVVKALEEKRISSALYSAWKCDPQFQAVIDRASEIVAHSLGQDHLPDFKETWTM